MSQLSIVNVKSENPKYPQNNVNITVDNDLNPNTTVIVPNTFFPYIIEFTNLPESLGKRYMSDWLYSQLINIHYKTPLGKALFTLDKELSVIPYYKLDYDVFRKMVNDIKSQTVFVNGETIGELEYVGSSIEDFNISPEYLLKWLDFPISNDKNEPINEFPLIIDYIISPIANIQIELLSKSDINNFYSNNYFVYITHNQNLSDKIYAEDSFIDYSDSLNNSLLGRQTVKDRIKNVNKRQTIDNLISTGGKVKNTIAGVNMAVAASAVASKLIANPPKIPKLPKIPRIALAPIIQMAIKLKIKKGEGRKQKGKSRKKIGDASEISQLSSRAQTMFRKPNLKNKFNKFLLDAKSKLQVTSITT